MTYSLKTLKARSHQQVAAVAQLLSQKWQSQLAKATGREQSLRGHFATCRGSPAAEPISGTSDVT